jgi:hypothetical protein
VSVYCFHLGATVAPRFATYSQILIVEKPIFTTDEFPADLDTTSIGLTITQPDVHVVDSVLDEMLQYTTQDGITMVVTRHSPAPAARSSNIDPTDIL